MSGAGAGALRAVRRKKIDAGRPQRIWSLFGDMLDNPPKSSGNTVKPAERPNLPGFYRERVLDIQHYTDKLFSFRTTRMQSFRFQSGQFTMIGLETGGRPILRAYSMASAVYEDWLEFFSIKVPDGPLTSKLQHIVAGDEIVVGAKPTGTLLASNLQPGSRLFLLATGTGVAPFASILRDPEIYERFDQVIAVEGCRQVAELAYATYVVEAVNAHEFLGELAAGKLLYYPTVTREPYIHQGRIPELIDSGKLCSDLGTAPFDLATDRVMLCGNPQMLADLRKLFAGRGFVEGSSGKPGDFVIEKAFAER
jgi:ferredoxin--NADP+ reductase